ncbi:MAG: type IV toxin-antitoxin system AbiEi family antitoxin [Gammaproteobacteria bacterium]
MNRTAATTALRQLDKQNKFLFTKHDLRKWFPLDTPKTFDAGLKRLVKDNSLEWVCHNVYLNPHAQSMDYGYTIEHVAKILRRGEYNYVSLESLLAEYGVISQIPIDRLTVITTGRTGEYKTKYGVIEFTHTKRPFSEIIPHLIKDPRRPLHIVSKQIAWRDLKRIGRNINMVNLEELNHED